MIASLRRRHRLFFIALALVLLPLLALALVDRPEYPDQELPGTAKIERPVPAASDSSNRGDEP